MSKSKKKQEALDYHAQGRPGKIEVVPTKPTNSQRDLSLAYSPGVAEPCLRIAENPEDAYKYTTKGNLVAVISNGTAVLGLGDIGAQASKPVMEGKGLLFKIFADIDVFDIELDTKDTEEFIRTVKALEPTFGGINLEDIKSPECFEIERRLKAELSIPVMHDDQHGTAIISAAALINACEIQGKKPENIKMVVNGAGAAAISCSKLYLEMGVKRENIIMCDRKGVIRKDRLDLDDIKRQFATDVNVSTLEDAMKGADVFVGLSSGNCVTPEMLLSMAAKPIVFAMANPDPEIAYDLAVKTRDDIIMATGRSDFPNQVNNVLGFPYIFRGALDVRATQINEAMKIAAVKAIADLAKKPVPEAVNLAYETKNLKFGSEYIIPKQLDNRLITSVSIAVAKAAIESGVARVKKMNWDAYEDELKKRLDGDDTLMGALTVKAKLAPKRVVFAEADNYKILRAAQIAKDEGVAVPILLGEKAKIKAIINEHEIDLDGVEIIDPAEEHERLEKYAKYLFERRQRRGITMNDALRLMKNRNYFGVSMVKFGEAEALISGLTRNYANTIRPALQVLGLKKNASKVVGMYMMLTKKGPVFFADTTINQNPSPEVLVEITRLVDEAVRNLNITPRIAMLASSNFGSNDGESSANVQEAVKILHEKYPKIIVDGEIQANFALNSELLSEVFPFSKLGSECANTLIFPNLESGNIGYKLIQELAEVEAVGPILLGLDRSVHVLQLGSSVREIVNMITLAVVAAQYRS